MSRAGLAASITMVLACSAGIASAATVAAPGSFTSRADKACAAAGAKVVALPVPTGATVVADLRSNRSIIAKLVGQLKAIKAPAAEAKAYAAFVASTSEQATLIGETLSAFNHHQSARITRLSDQAEAVGKRSDAEARSLGLPVCAKDYSPSAMSGPGTPTTPTTTSTTPPSTTPKPSTTPAASSAATPAAPVAAAPAAPSAPAASAGSSGSDGSSGSPAGSQSGSQSSSGSSSGGQSITGILTSS
jgi:uncharacterized membrane protein YgcG